MNGYVQDERYTAGAGSAGVVPLSFARCVSHGCAGVARVNFAQCLAISMAAKATWPLISRHAVNPSMGARARRHVSHGLETRDHTPLALWVLIPQWILTDVMFTSLQTHHHPHSDPERGYRIFSSVPEN